MSTQPLERTDLELIEALDWDYAPQCEHSCHGTPRFHDGGPAYALARGTTECPTCGTCYGPIIYSCRKWTKTEIFLCGCGAKVPGRVHILALVTP